MARLHNELMAHIASEVQAVGDDVRIFGRQPVVIRCKLCGNMRYVSQGLTGQCDQYGTIGAVHFEIESKVHKDVLSKEQLDWRDTCRSAGIPWMEVRAVKREDIPRKAKETAEWVRSLRRTHAAG